MSSKVTSLNKNFSVWFIFCLTDILYKDGISGYSYLFCQELRNGLTNRKRYLTIWKGWQISLLSQKNLLNVLAITSFLE